MDELSSNTTLVVAIHDKDSADAVGESLLIFDVSTYLMTSICHPLDPTQQRLADEDARWRVQAAVAR